MKIVGNTVGTTLPKPNLKQTNPNEGDFVKGKEIIPTKVSQLENDSGYLTEHQDVSGKLDADKLPEAVNKALAQAKESGEFNGAPGKDGVGIPGTDGKSAYQYAQDAGYTGTEEEFGIKLATEHIDWFGKGIAIPSGADLNTYKTNGKYYANSESIGKSLLNRPDGMNTNFVMWVFSRTTDSIKSQLMLTLSGKMYIRSSNSNGWRGWVAYTTSGEIETLTEEVKNQLITELEQYSGYYTLKEGETLADAPEWAKLVVNPYINKVEIPVKQGLTVAVIGDSISTFYGKNACEVVIAAEDVGVELSSYITHYDIGKTISKDGLTSGYTITAEDVGNEMKFVPCSDDVGKKLGEPKNYNTSAKTEKTWWQVAADALGFEPIAAAWSGSSITSHESSGSSLKCSHAWHDHTIRKLGKRIPGSMNRIAPDVAMIYRGTNDLSHSTKVRLTNGYFDTVDWYYPTTDLLADGATYGFKEGLAMTIQKIRTTYPRARIVLCTCNVFKRSKYSHFPTHNGYFSIPQMNNAIREVADFFGCHVVELDKCGITWENCYDEGYITDSATKPTHPNTSGHALMGQQAISDLIHKVHISDIEHTENIIEFIASETTETDTPVTPDAKVNIIGYGTLVEGQYVTSSSGIMKAGTAYYTYTEIPVDGNALYDAPYVRNYAFYDADGARVGGGTGDGVTNAVLTAPATAVTLAATYKYVDLAPDDVEIIKQGSDEPDNGQTKIGDLYGTLMDNHYIDTDDGTLVEYTSEVKYFAYTDIAVEGSTTYSAPYARNTAFYDDDGIYISHVGAGGSATATITTPDNAAFMAVTYQHKNFTSPAAVTITKA